MRDNVTTLDEIDERLDALSDIVGRLMETRRAMKTLSKKVLDFERDKLEPAERAYRKAFAEKREEYDRHGHREEDDICVRLGKNLIEQLRQEFDPMRKESYRREEEVEHYFAELVDLAGFFRQDALDASQHREASFAFVNARGLDLRISYLARGDDVSAHKVMKDPDGRITLL